MIDFRLLILMPIVIGFLMLILPEILKTLKAVFSLVISAFILYLAISIFKGALGSFTMPCLLFPSLNSLLLLKVDGLSKLIVLFIGFFGFLYCIYSLVYVTRGKQLINYYPYFLITLGAANGAALSDNFIVFVFDQNIRGADG